MGGNSVKQAKKLLFVATLLIFLLLLFLKNIPANLFLSLPVEVPSATAAGLSHDISLGVPAESRLEYTFAGKESRLPGIAAAPQPLKNTSAGEEIQLPPPPGKAVSPYTLGKAQRRDLRVRLQVTNTGDTPSSNIRLDVPLIGELDSPYQTVIGETFTHVPEEIKNVVPGNRCALFQIGTLAPGESETLILTYQLQAYPLKAELPALAALSSTQAYYPAAYSPDSISITLAQPLPEGKPLQPPGPEPTAAGHESPPDPVLPPGSVPLPDPPLSPDPGLCEEEAETHSITAPRQELVSRPDLTAWLKPSAKIESDHPEIINRARKLTAGVNNELDQARLIFNYVKGYMHYDLNSPHRNKGALSALRTADGVCEDYAALFVALCRASGIPARQVNGYADSQSNGAAWQLAPAQTFSLKGYRHSWAEFYLAGAGWLPADPTLNIYDTRLTYFASLPRVAHLAQNYADQPLRVRFQGGKIAVVWEEELTGM